MIEVVEGLDGAKRDRIRALGEARRFFWVDVSASETRRSDLGEALGIPEPALQALLSFGDGHPSARRFYADGQHVVFAIGCYLESDQLRDGSHYRLQALEVRVVVSGEYLLTVHQERVSLLRCWPLTRPRDAASNTSSTRCSTRWSPARSMPLTRQRSGWMALR